MLVYVVMTVALLIGGVLAIMLFHTPIYESGVRAGKAEEKLSLSSKGPLVYMEETDDGWAAYSDYDETWCLEMDNPHDLILGIREWSDRRFGLEPRILDGTLLD